MLNLPPNPQFCQTDVSGSTFVNADCFDVFPFIEDKSIDAIICDLPYGTTACKWDTIIPFEPLWAQYKRIIKDNGAIVLFGSQPFTSALVMSNVKWFKYEWIWEKSRPSGIAQSKYQPMKKHENICVFANGKTIFNAIREQREHLGKPTNRKFKTQNTGSNHGLFPTEKKMISSDRNPTTVLKFPSLSTRANGGILHPTQKPVPLLEYLIKTYTNENDTVLDNTMGSGTTGLACLKTNRQFIGIEKEKQYYDVAVRRASEYCH